MDKNKVMELFVTDALKNDHFVMRRENDQVYQWNSFTDGFSKGIWKWKKETRYGRNEVETMTVGVVDGELSSYGNSGKRGDKVPPWWKRNPEPFYRFGDELVWGGGIDPRVWKSWLLRDPMLDTDFSSTMGTRGLVELKDPRFHPGDYRYDLGNDPETLRLAENPPTEVEFRKMACPYTLIKQPDHMCPCGNAKQNHEYLHHGRRVKNERKRNKDGTVTEKLPWYGHNLDRNVECGKCRENVAFEVSEKVYMFRKCCAFACSQNSRSRVIIETRKKEIEKLNNYPPFYYPPFWGMPPLPPLLPKYRKQIMGRLRREGRKQTRTKRLN